MPLGAENVALPPTRYVSSKYWLAASIWSLWAPLGNEVASRMKASTSKEISIPVPGARSSRDSRHEVTEDHFLHACLQANATFLVKGGVSP
jgi:hypothetical protein